MPRPPPAYSNVNVFYYAEANRVRDAMLNGPNNNVRMINAVVPYVTNLDYLSYSSYDAMNLSASDLYTTLNYMQAHLPTNKAGAVPGERMWIGEYGWGGNSTASQEPLNRAYIQRLLGWNYGGQCLQFILFWEMYDNEVGKNFCLIDSNNVQTASWYLASALHQQGASAHRPIQRDPWTAAHGHGLLVAHGSAAEPAVARAGEPDRRQWPRYGYDHNLHDRGGNTGAGNLRQRAGDAVGVLRPAGRRHRAGQLAAGRSVGREYQLQPGHAQHHAHQPGAGLDLLLSLLCHQLQRGGLGAGVGLVRHLTRTGRPSAPV